MNAEKTSAEKTIDIHCHLNFPEYDKDRKKVIDRARSRGVSMIVVGTNLETSKKAVAIAEENDDIWAIVGLHPIYTHCEDFDEKAFADLARNEKVVGIGECGFDFFHRSAEDKDEKSRQEKAFLAQIDLANNVKKPLMLHLRGERSYRDALDILKKESKVIGDAHFFAGKKEEAREFYDIGFTTSFTGVITFSNDYDELIDFAPKNMIMSETDAPYVAPVPYRGQRCEPAYVTEVVKKISKIKGDDMPKELINNARRVFSIPL